MLKAIILQIQFFTRISILPNIKFDENKLVKYISLLPLVGLLIGLILAGLYYLVKVVFALDSTNQQLLVALLIVFLETIMTGALHLDGLADTFDGLFSNRSKEKILEIMKDSCNGTFGTLSLVFIILLKVILLANINKKYMLFTIILMPVLGRMSIIWSAGLSKYARRTNELGMRLINKAGYLDIIISSSLSLTIGLLFSFVFDVNIKILIFAFIILILFVIYYTQYIKKNIGGATGDTLGSIVELSEVLFIAAMIIASSTYLKILQ